MYKPYADKPVLTEDQYTTVGNFWPKGRHNWTDKQKATVDTALNAVKSLIGSAINGEIFPYALNGAVDIILEDTPYYDTDAYQQLGTSMEEIYADCIKHALSDMAPNAETGIKAFWALDRATVILNAGNENHKKLRAAFDADKIGAIDSITKKFLSEARDQTNMISAWRSVIAINVMHDTYNIDLNDTYARLGIDKQELYTHIAFRQNKKTNNQSMEALGRYSSSQDAFKHVASEYFHGNAREQLLDIANELIEMIPNTDHPANGNHLANQVRLIADKCDFDENAKSLVEISIVAALEKGNLHRNKNAVVARLDAGTHTPQEI